MMHAENSSTKNEEKVQQQRPESEGKPSPFKETTAPNTERNAAEESDLEQKRKEALTERD